MEREHAKDFDQELLDLYDDYAHGRVGRREFARRAAAFAVGGITAEALLARLSPNYALAQQVAPDDARIHAEYVTYESPKGGGKIRGLLARPKAEGAKFPAVLVIHENRGLNPYIEDVARRLAVQGFLALAPDALTPAGRIPGERRRGPRHAGEARPRPDDGGLHRGGRVPQDAPEFDREGRRGRLLLRRGHGQHARRADPRDDLGGGAVLRPPTPGRRTCPGSRPRS